ncbi:unnamed protein product [Rotaria socialis]|uniref:MULE transposase domain-containing protein n=1 Tax=Rotaria socialis TaxID=392032 RepID=A0A820WXD6_9BILA|nr:unnamed protein product [Rotaria socialis]CAF4524269.1 unnamed protein product [Rotaria socialis]
MVVHGGFFYTLERTTTTKCIFRCRNRDCKARCHTSLSMDSFLSEPTVHSHAPDPECIPAFELKSQIKIKAMASNEASSSILHSELRLMPLTAVGSLPKSDSLMRTIRRQRSTPCLDPSSRLPDHLRKTDRGEEFILFEDDEMIIFTTKTNLSLLKSCKHWFVDGTFKVCPEEFYQLFTLHALLKSVIVPLVYGLLIGKKASDYKKNFQKILDEDDFEPESILSDFESGTIKTIKEVFPNAVHRGCLFHFGQCVWRHIQDNGLSKKYQEDEYFRLNVRKLLSLPFVPTDNVAEAFDIVADDFEDDADNIVEYFEKTWIGQRKKRGTGRKKPIFNYELWNVYERVINNLPRSNNSVEAWHCPFANRVSMAHPSTAKLADKIRREQSKFEIDIQQMLQGHQPQLKKLVYRKLNERMIRVVNMYNKNELNQYLNNISANIII